MRQQIDLFDIIHSFFLLRHTSTISVSPFQRNLIRTAGQLHYILPQRWVVEYLLFDLIRQECLLDLSHRPIDPVKISPDSSLTSALAKEVFSRLV
jgi:hypothetical protein